MSNAQLIGKDPKTYTVFGLLNAGLRFSDDYDADDAVEQFLSLHPEALESDVRAALKAEMAKHGL